MQQIKDKNYFLEKLSKDREINKLLENESKKNVENFWENLKEIRRILHIKEKTDKKILEEYNKKIIIPTGSEETLIRELNQFNKVMYDDWPEHYTLDISTPDGQEPFIVKKIIDPNKKNKFKKVDLPKNILGLSNPYVQESSLDLEKTKEAMGEDKKIFDKYFESSENINDKEKDELEAIKKINIALDNIEKILTIEKDGKDLELNKKIKNNSKIEMVDELANKNIVSANYNVDSAIKNLDNSTLMGELFNINLESINNNDLANILFEIYKSHNNIKKFTKFFNITENDFIQIYGLEFMNYISKNKDDINDEVKSILTNNITSNIINNSINYNFLNSEIQNEVMMFYKKNNIDFVEDKINKMINLLTESYDDFKQKVDITKINVKKIHELFLSIKDDERSFLLLDHANKNLKMSFKNLTVAKSNLENLKEVSKVFNNKDVLEIFLIKVFNNIDVANINLKTAYNNLNIIGSSFCEYKNENGILINFIPNEEAKKILSEDVLLSKDNFWNKSILDNRDLNDLLNKTNSTDNLKKLDNQIEKKLEHTKILNDNEDIIVSNENEKYKELSKVKYQLDEGNYGKLNLTRTMSITCAKYMNRLSNLKKSIEKSYGSEIFKKITDLIAQENYLYRNLDSNKKIQELKNKKIKLKRSRINKQKVKSFFGIKTRGKVSWKLD
ncbi:hypothetical protein SHELI_v1c05650 [Spiroplasma helicoides]|uniref:Uncharacterized protein n=1 Tax=Spiroplasma helicoides TaxID=216938 RepID=A0A1B3SKR8_9MOLU|nr:hypothetical protein [Spiroplasma helicoides]AOG60516.1 hypothetical protein SHELI_v1c05650 [Spiroplasma helicoides]